VTSLPKSLKKLFIMADEDGQAREGLLDKGEVSPEKVAYTAEGSKTMTDLLRHFFSRGHEGRVTCVDASAAADFVVSGGVDYTVRIWKYDIHHAAYDLFAILVQTPPPAAPEPPKGCCAPLCELIFGKPEIDYEKIGPVGITAVAPVSSRYMDPFNKSEKMRNGPIASGNAQGDFYLHNLYSRDEDGIPSVKGSYQRISKLHDGPIHDLAVAPLYKDDEQGNVFHLATSGDDGKVKIIMITGEELDNPDYEERPDPPQGLDAVIPFFFKGAGIPRPHKKKKEGENADNAATSAEADAPPTKEADVEAAVIEMAGEGDEDEGEFDDEEEEEEEEVEDKFVLAVFEPMQIIHTLEHKSSVDCCRFVGDFGKKKVRWVTCTTDTEAGSHGVWLWSGDGNLLMQLSLDMPVYSHVAFNKTLGEWELKSKKEGKKAKDLNGVVAAWKKNGSVIFASTDAGKEKYVAVWAIDREGGIGKLETEDGDGSTRIVYQEPKDFPAVDGGYHFFTSKGLTYAPPLAIYEQDGVLMDIDKQIEGTAFVTDVRQDYDLAMWNIEAAPKNSMLVMPQDPANLLVMPGREKYELTMTHKSKVIDTQVVEDSEGPAIVVGCDDGAVYAWDLGGHDKGQIYAEMRSLSPMEVFLPPLLLIVSALQVVSFAFGPAIPWKKTVKQPAVVTHQVMMLDFKFTVKIDKAMIFWPEMIAVVSFIVLFLYSAITGLPGRADEVCRSIQNSKQYRDEVETSPGLAHVALKVTKTFTTLVYLLMQLLSTALVVPICQSIAESVQCVYPEGTPWTEALMGNPNNSIYLASTPDVLCFQGHHTMLVLAICLVLPAYLYILVPYAVCAGDAHYVPSNILFDWKVWEDKNTWWKAAERSATDLHLAFLHPNPREVFRTNILELMAKILLPVVTILLAPNPLVEMIFVFLIGLVMWVNSMVHPPYVEKKMTILVQDLKLFTMLVMACGVLTVYLEDPESMLPVYCLIGSGAFVVILMIFQFSLLDSNRPVVHQLIVSKESPIEEVASG